MGLSLINVRGSATQVAKFSHLCSGLAGGELLIALELSQNVVCSSPDKLQVRI